MWVLMMLAPAEVPPTTAPPRCAAWMAVPSDVPVTCCASLSWLPPVRKTPLAVPTTAAMAGSPAPRRPTGRTDVTLAAPSREKTLV